jgi:RimJ/RimL family protein N-acetyltransferase
MTISVLEKIMQSEKFSFKPLQETDLTLLCIWFNKPHVKQWWNDDLTDAQITAKYQSRIGNTQTVPFIVYLNSKAIGFIQYHQEAEDTISIDQFIGEEEYLNRGYGTGLVTAFIEKLFTNPVIKKIMTDVNPDNARAQRCYEKAGFMFVKEISTPQGIVHVMEKRRVD